MVRIRILTLALTLFTTSACQTAPLLTPVAIIPRTNGLIAFESTRDNSRDIYVMSADGSNIHNLTHNPEFDFSPVWSPDGTQIAFQSFRDDQNGEI
jgi:hypothetical protein